MLLSQSLTGSISLISESCGLALKLNNSAGIKVAHSGFKTKGRCHVLVAEVVIPNLDVLESKLKNPKVFKAYEKIRVELGSK